MHQRVLLGAVVGVSVLVSAPRPPSGEQLGFYNILPPGQDGVLNTSEAAAFQSTGTLPPHVDDQLAMYGDLVYQSATPGMRPGDLLAFFKKAPISTPSGSVDRTYSPGGRSDVLVRRDAAFGVPHISATTRTGAMFAQGYTGAEDRLFLMDVLRHLGRARLSEFLGASEANLQLDADQLAVAPYTEADLTAQMNAIATATSDGPQLVADGQAYIEGVNQYIREARTDPNKLPAEYPALQLSPQHPEDFVPQDIVAIASLVGGIFGKGGGGEVQNYCGLRELEAELGSAADARAVFDDLTFRDDPEAPTTVQERVFPYMSNLGTPDPAAIPDIDCASLAPLEAPPVDSGGMSTVEVVPTPPLARPTNGGEALLQGLRFPEGLSNALLIAADRTVGGRPIAVFGPQTAYFIPQLLVEKAVSGPGISARGVAFAGTDLYVQLGHGAGYAWSATSAGGDNVDQFILELCEPAGGPPTTDSMGYFHAGQCKPIESFTETFSAKPSPGSFPPETVLVVQHWERAPDYGPLSARGLTERGVPIAVASKRSTYQAELASARGFKRINDPAFMSRGFASFREAMGQGVDYTFNWFYVDRKDIGYQHSCKCPQRHQGVDPYLPRWGTGAWDWQGFIPFASQPFAKNPAQGFLTSWNNKQAKGFLANDRQSSYGPVYRSLLLDRRIRSELAEGPIDLGEAVDIMALAGTTDLRAQEIVPLLARAMGAAAPSGADPRAQEMFDRLVSWAADDLGHRRDHDGDGTYDDPQAPAILDAWWPRLVDAMFQSRSADARRKLGLELHDPPQNHLGSAFQGGFYSHVQKDLRQLLGEPVLGAGSRTYCGGGDLASCRTDLWSSLGEAALDLEAAFGSPSVADWKRSLADDAIPHTAVGIATVPDIHWVNRPTFQQVVQVGTDVSAP